MIRRALALSLVLAAAFGLAGPALADQAPAADPAASLAQDWQAYTVSQGHVLDDMRALIQQAQELKTKNTDLQKQLDAAKPKTDEKAAPEKPAAPAPEKPK